MAIQPQNPIEEYILSALMANGFEKMDDEAQKTYFPQFVAQAEQRLGAALLPLLNQESAKEFALLSGKGKTDPGEWWKFWEKHVPNFLEVVKKSLGDFANEMKDAFNA